MAGRQLFFESKRASTNMVKICAEPLASVRSKGYVRTQDTEANITSPSPHPLANRLLARNRSAGYESAISALFGARPR